jgi:hypothetical protein
LKFKGIVHKWTGIGALVDHKIIYKKYDEEKDMEWSTSNQIWKEDKEKVIRIWLHFSNERINITL